MKNIDTFIEHFKLRQIIKFWIQFETNFRKSYRINKSISFYADFHNYILIFYDKNLTIIIPERHKRSYALQIGYYDVEDNKYPNDDSSDESYGSASIEEGSDGGKQ